LKENPEDGLASKRDILSSNPSAAVKTTKTQKLILVVDSVAESSIQADLTNEGNEFVTRTSKWQVGFRHVKAWLFI
jgi:hypothetical protein